MIISGSCHCRNVTFALRWEPDPLEIPVRACDCSFCAKHGGNWTSHPQGRLEVVVQDPTLVARYGFGTRTADFHVCTRCGIVPVVTSLIDGHLYAVVNVNTFDAPATLTLKPGTAHFDDETEDVRLARRTKHWIADVRILPGSR